MTAEIISVGTEILLGDIVNTNAAYISKKCAELGVFMYCQSVVGDNDHRLRKIFDETFLRADIVILTGGLGPTEDDLTKETVCDVLGIPLVRDEAAEENMVRILQKYGKMPSANNYKQALVPKDCIVMYNKNGTAPGIIIEKDGKAVVLLPGPPGEMVPMFEEYVVPYIKSKNPEVLYSATIKECGIGESLLETMLLDLIDNQTNPTIATYAKTGCCEIRITAKAADTQAAKALVEPVVSEIRKRLSDNIYSEKDDDNIENAVVKLLSKYSLKLTTAESCTGGLIGSKIVNVSGASEVFSNGYITYSDDAKAEMITVPKDLILKHTAVSAEVAKAMAEGALKVSGADISISVTGYAGPLDTEKEPKGLVYLACSFKSNTDVKELHLSGNRSKIRENAAVWALDFIRRTIINFYKSED